MIVTALIVTHLLVHVLYYAFDQSELVKPLLGLFNIGRDGNIPTVYSFLAMFFAAALLAVIALDEMAKPNGRAEAPYWWGLTVIFLFLACDESMELHERLIVPGREAFGLSGIFYYAWVIPYGIFALLIFGLYLRFLLRLPREIAWLFVLAGGTYVAGALGMEMMGGWYWETHVLPDQELGSLQTMIAIQTVEESMEMMGIVTFIYALARYADEHNQGISLVISR